MPRFPKGTLLFYGDDVLANNPSWTEVTELIKVDIPIGYEVAEEDTTTHQHAESNNFTRYSPLLADEEEIEFEIFFDTNEVSHLHFQNDRGAGNICAWKAAVPPEDPNSVLYEVYTFDGFLKSFTEE